MPELNKYLIEEFCKVTKTDIKDWVSWKEENPCSNKIIIAGPSRIIGLIDLNKIDEEIDWNFYSKNTVPTKKMKGNFVFGNKMFGVRWLKFAFQMIGEIVEVATYLEAIVFKLTEDVALGIGNKALPDDFYYNDEGVMFVECDFEETQKSWRTVTKAKEFIKWENGMAKRKHSGKANVWYEEVYRWEYFFEEELDDMGDMMML